MIKTFETYKKDIIGESLMKMLYKGITDNDMGMVKQALDNDANIEYIRLDLPRIKNTPLIIATYKGRYEIVKYLIKRGAKVDGKNIHNDTALSYAAYYGEMDILEYLIEKGADVFHRGTENDTALEVAVNQGQLEVVIYLTDYIIEHHPDRVKEVEEFIPEDIKKEHPILFRGIKTGLWDLKKESFIEDNYDFNKLKTELFWFFTDQNLYGSIQFNDKNDLSPAYTSLDERGISQLLNQGESINMIFSLQSQRKLSERDGNPWALTQEEVDERIGLLENFIKEKLPDFNIKRLHYKCELDEISRYKHMKYRILYIVNIAPKDYVTRSNKSGLWDFEEFNGVESTSLKKESMDRDILISSLTNKQILYTTR
jgi:hypothetical protein